MAESMSTLIAVLAQALLHFLWQGALIGVAAALLLGVLRDARPQARYLVACLALLACVLAPVLTMLWSWLADGAAPAVASSAPVVAGTTAATFAAGTALLDYVTPATGIDAYHPAIVATWAAGMGMMSLRIVLGLAWIRRLPVADDRVQHLVWQSRVDVLAMHFRLSRAVELRLVHALESPAATGWVRPVVLLPVALLARLPADLVEALLAHELAHVRRHDYLVNLLQNAVEAALFYHPVTWWLSHRIRIEREQVADQLASEVACSPRRLALALSGLADFQRTPPALHLVQAAHGGQLMSRIEQLVRPTRRNHPSARIVFPLLGLVAFSIATYTYARMEEPVGQPEPAVQSGVGEGAIFHTSNGKVADPADVAVEHHGTIVVDSKVERQRKVERSRNVDVRIGDGRSDYYALVDKHGEHIRSQGSLDMEAVDTLKKLPDGEVLWFRRGGKDYVVTDPAVLARAHAAWRDADAIGKQMEPLSAQMDVHGKKMDALGAKMEALSADHKPTPRMQAAEREMRALGRKQRELAREQSLLQDQVEDARDDEARARVLERKRDALSEQEDALAERMDRQSEIIDAEAARLDELAKPMDELGRQMDLASKPMDELGRQMDALGKQMDVAAKKAEAQTHAIIDEALARNLARPMQR
jgi:beta-lactamase regulating signal transducer with metallopeptidase domain